MMNYELTKLKVHREILTNIISEYGINRSLGNVRENIEQRIKYYEENESDN